MVRPTALLIAACLGLAVPHLASAQQASAGPPSPEAIAAARAAVGETDFDRISRDRDYAIQVLGHLDLLASAPDVYAEVGRGIETLRLRPLLTLERTDEVRATIGRLLAMRLDEAEQYRLPIYASLSIEDYSLFAAAVEAASRNVRASGWGPLRELLDREFVWPLLHRLRERDKPAADPPGGRPVPHRLAGWKRPGGRRSAPDDPARGCAGPRAIGEAAVGFAAGITSPGVLTPLLILKRYDGLLPETGDRLAPLREALEARERWTAEAVARDGENLERRLDRVQHLRAMGRNGDALALAQPQLRDPNASALASEEGMWLVNESAYALLDLGRPAEAAQIDAGADAAAGRRPCLSDQLDHQPGRNPQPGRAARGFARPRPAARARLRPACERLWRHVDPGDGRLRARPRSGAAPRRRPRSRRSARRRTSIRRR